MVTAKTTTLTFRIEPELKEALRTAAQNEHRSIVNMVAVLIRNERGPLRGVLPLVFKHQPYSPLSNFRRISH